MKIPLFTPTDVPDAWHQVIAPGGYESWRFNADDESGELRMVAGFSQGFVLHTAYLRAYLRYRRRPTRCAPPLPAENPSVFFVLYRGDEIVGQFMARFPADQFTAAVNRCEVRIGSNTLHSDHDGALRLELTGVPSISTWRRLKLLETQLLSATFQFTPKLPQGPMQKSLFPRPSNGAEHYWAIIDPLCKVSGEVILKDTSNKSAKRFGFAGCGYHDHHFGTGPIDSAIRRVMRGRVLLDDHAIIFQLIQSAKGPDELHLLESEPMGSREIVVDDMQADWSRRTNTLLRYPDHLQAGPLRLHSPRVIDASLLHLRLIYEATVRGEPTTVLCEIVCPHRLRWPLLGRLIESPLIPQ